MFEITIKGVVYQFHFGMGFMREINKTISRKLNDSMPDVKKNIGLQYKIGGLMDGDLEVLVEVLEIANKGQNPRVTRALLDAHIDDPETDIDALFAEVLDFLESSNATKKTVLELRALVEAEKAKAKAQNN